MANLRNELLNFLEDWQRDVPVAWRQVLFGVSPDIESVPSHLTLEAGEQIYPLRKGHGDPRAPADSHVFRALDGLLPSEVRAVLIGQDPYPKIARATGRSFEQGDLYSWDGNVAKSLRRMLQTLVQHRMPSDDYVANDSEWEKVLSKISNERLTIEPPRALFDHWQTAGVLCLNLGLTLSRFDRPGTPAADRVQPAHMALWQPVVREILVHLARRTDRELLVVLWGKKAQDAFAQMGVGSAAGRMGKLAVVMRSHPSANGPSGNAGASPFLKLDDPFTQANKALLSIGAAPITW